MPDGGPKKMGLDVLYLGPGWVALQPTLTNQGSGMLCSEAMSNPTTIPKASSVVVVVAGSPDLIAAVRQAAGVAAAARVETAELANAATVVATQRPFAIVMDEVMYSFDAAEFEALARDVGATLIRVDTTNATRTKLERTLMPKLGQAHRRRGGA
jgi:hypothetical protein